MQVSTDSRSSKGSCSTQLRRNKFKNIYGPRSIRNSMNLKEKMKSKMAKPLVGKQLLDLLLVLSNHLTTSGFKHHKPDVFGRSWYDNLDFRKGTIYESESGAVEREKMKGTDSQTITLYWTSPGRLPRPMQSCWRPQRCSVLHLKTVARWLCKGMGFSTLGYTGSSWASQWCVTCPWLLWLN